jgi:pimeloyl-ACP methyl ester carboxylesterase
LRSIYRTSQGREAIRRWCEARLDAWPVPHRRETVAFEAGTAHLTLVGDGPVKTVFVPGTNFNAATCLPVAAALGRHWSTMVIDMPGQPGLSSGDRPRSPHDGWFGRTLKAILDAADVREVIVVGNSLGAAIALGCDSDRIAGRVLYSPGGIVPLRTDSLLILRSLPWLLRPTEDRSRALLRLFTAPGGRASETVVEWMTLAARHCRSTLAPPPLPPDALARWADTPLEVATGQHDRFLPPERLEPVVRQVLGRSLRVLPGVGHLAVEERPEDVIDVVRAVADRIERTDTGE